MIGLDEVGRGSWAGPLLVAAVQMFGQIDGLDDSKKLSSQKRRNLALDIKMQASDISLFWCNSELIDQIGLAKALSLSFKSAFSEIINKKDDIFIDGNINYLEEFGAKTIIKGDSSNPAISAASIVAKVHRDNFMMVMNRRFPGYGFDSNVGYGTKQHHLALEKHGITTIHRHSFSPIKDYDERS